MYEPPPDPGDYYEPVEDEPVEPPALEVDVTDPEILGYLLGPNGDPIATLLNRRPIPFGFQRDYRPGRCDGFS